MILVDDDDKSIDNWWMIKNTVLKKITYDYLSDGMAGHWTVKIADIDGKDKKCYRRGSSETETNFFISYYKIWRMKKINL